MLTILIGLLFFALFIAIVKRVVSDGTIQNVATVIILILAIIWLFQALPGVGIHPPAVLTK